MGPGDHGGEPLVVEALQRFADLSVERRTWLALARDLLDVCHERSGPAEAWVERAPASWVEDAFTGVSAQASALLGSHDSAAFVSTPVAQALTALAQSELAIYQSADDLDEAIVAYGLALAVDAHAGHTFIEAFRAELRIEVGPGVPYPVRPHDPRLWLGGLSANTRPDRLPSRRLDAIPHLRLGTHLHRTYGLVLEFDMWHHLAPLTSAPRLRIATVHANLTLDDFDVRIEDVNGRKIIRNTGPKDADTQQETLVRAVAAAVARQATVVLIPEYSLAAEHRERFQNAIDELDPHPLLMVAATSEVEGDVVGWHTNEAWISVPDHRALMSNVGVVQDGPLRHGFGLHKIFAAEVNRMAEGIAGARGLAVVKSESVTLAVLICRDAASPDLMSVLADCGVNLLLVPAFSDRTGSIVGNATHLSVTSQSFVAVAVAPAEWRSEEDAPSSTGRVEAAFSGPYEHPPGPLSAPSVTARRGEGPGIWLFDAATRSVEWIDV